MKKKLNKIRKYLKNNIGKIVIRCNMFFLSVAIFKEYGYLLGVVVLLNFAILEISRLRLDMAFLELYYLRKMVFFSEKKSFEEVLKIYKENGKVIGKTYQ